MVSGALVPGCALAADATGAPARITSVASIDIGAGSNAGNTTATNKRRDRVSVDCLGAALERIDIAWERGVTFRPIPQQRKARLIGALEVTQVNDPSADTSYDDAAQAPMVTAWNVWLRPGARGHRLTLWLRGPSTSVTARVDGRGTPNLRIRGLPERTVSVSFHTSGRLGVGLLSRQHGRVRTPPVRTRISGMAGGVSFSLIADDESGD